MKAIGIDIGTTSIKAVLFSFDGMKEEKIERCENAFLSREDASEDPELIFSNVDRMLDNLVRFSSETPSAISISSQMHGILYLDRSGRPVSPFYTWQNRWGAAVEDELSRMVGYPIHAGYGITTHRANSHVPADASCFSSIGAYVAMRLAGLSRPVEDATLAESLGIYDAASGHVASCFDDGYLPHVVDEPTILGLYRDIPVVTAIGDNQASFLAATAGIQDEAIHLNYGTGSQISFLSDRCHEGFEPRSFGRKRILNVYSSLSGGDAYSILARFFSSVVSEFSQCDAPDVYGVMDSFPIDDSRMVFEPYFMGLRSDPSRRAFIGGIGKDNFTASALTNALVRGMAEELFDCYDGLCEDVKALKKTVVASGNGIRRNARLQHYVRKLFGRPLVFSPFQEEAAAGAAMNAIVGQGACGSYREVSSRMCLPRS